MTYIDLVKWPEIHEIVRERMRKQPRGYQLALAKALGKTPGFVNQIVTGRIAIPLEQLDAVLDSLNMEYDVTLKEKS